MKRKSKKQLGQANVSVNPLVLAVIKQVQRESNAFGDVYHWLCESDPDHNHVCLGFSGCVDVPIKEVQ